MEGISEDPSANTLDSPTQPEASFPTALHFLHQEWRRFEGERNLWELEKSELKTKLSVLEGEKRGFEVLKTDLLRRIKMLEFALRQERAKHLASQAKTETPAEGSNSIVQSASVDIAPPPKEPTVATESAGDGLSISSYTSASINRSFTLGKYKSGTSRTREILKQYLQEVGFNEDQVTSSVAPSPYSAGTFGANSPSIAPRSVVGSSVMRQLFVPPESGSPVIQRSDSVDKASRRQQVTDSIIYAPEDMEKLKNSMNWAQVESDNSSGSSLDAWSTILPSTSGDSGNKSRPSSILSEVDSELASLKVQDEIESESASTKSNKTKPQERAFWATKFTLKSHLDSVTAVAFHSTDLCLVTASEDGCIKYWNLETAAGLKKPPPDIEPIHSLRGHRGAVTSALMTSIIPASIDPDRQEYLEHGGVLSAGTDGKIFFWSLPSKSQAPYSPYEFKKRKIAQLAGHQDAIWELKQHSISPIISSASADGKVLIWNLNSIDDSFYAGDPETPIVRQGISWDGPCSVTDIIASPIVPTSIEFMPQEANQIVVSFSNSELKTFDLESGRECLKYTGASQSYDGTTGTQINRVVAHAALNFVITAHEDRHIRFHDTRSGECVHTMIAHLDSVSSLDISPNGLVLASGGHDGSTRMWDISSFSCLQEFTFHRKKFDEAIKCVQFHPRTVLGSQTSGASGTSVSGGSGWLATSGADSCAKIYSI